MNNSKVVKRYKGFATESDGYSVYTICYGAVEEENIFNNLDDALSNFSEECARFEIAQREMPYLEGGVYLYDFILGEIVDEIEAEG